MQTSRLYVFFIETDFLPIEFFTLRG